MIIQEEVSTEIACSIAITEEDENELPLSEWVRRIDSVNFASCDLDGFSSVDVLTAGTLTAEDNCDGSKKINKTVHLMKRIYKKMLKNKKLK